MSVRIQLDRPYAHFTNLDYITGRVIFSLTTDETISGVIVKLEGESRTRLAGPRSVYNDRPDRNKTEIEVHKLLYKVITVFPSPDVQRHGSGNASYTLSPGQYEYPFQFKLPINNNCSNNNTMFTNLNVAGLRMEMARDTYKHVKKTLPPSLNGFPGEAEIKYFVKVTVVRPQLWKENRRSIADFKFFPIEPPRPSHTKQESYARRQHQFTKGLAAIPLKKGLFVGFKKVDPASLIEERDPPRFSIDARLPNPAIITCNEPLPLRILVQRLNEGSEMIFLQMLQIDLIGYTKVRAHELTRTESGSWVITSVSNLKMPLWNPEDVGKREVKVDSRLWDKIPLPNTVAPSFDTCNISRAYELEVKVGLAHGLLGKIKPELIVLPLRMPVQVFSGIAPPEALLSAMAASRPPASPNAGVRPPSLVHSAPPTPTTPSYSSSPPQPGEYGPPLPTGDDDAPPSYEDAMAEDVGPVDGPRREYNQPDVPPGAPRISNDGKSSGERLFPETELRGHS